MDALSRLQTLIGKDGLLHTNAGELEFTFLSVELPAKLPASADEDQDFQNAITRSQFQVRFKADTLVDGSDTMIASGRYISSIKNMY